MHSHSIESWQHDHVFGQDQPQEGERRTKWVIALTATTMVVEIICGIMFGSMALWRWLAYGFAYRRVGNRCFCILIRAPKCRQSGVQFWHRKNQFAGRFYRSHLIVGVRPVDGLGKCRTFWNPVGIEFNSAIFVAIIGLLVNGASVFLLSTGGNSGHSHSHSQRPLSRPQSRIRE